MKKGFKVLGFTALAASLAALIPYKVKKDEETGEISAKALLWEGTHTPATEDREREITVNVRPDLTDLKQKVEEIKEKVVGETEIPEVDFEFPEDGIEVPTVKAEIPAVEIETPVVEAEAPVVNETPETPIW